MLSDAFSVLYRTEECPEHEELSPPPPPAPKGLIRTTPIPKLSILLYFLTAIATPWKVEIKKKYTEEVFKRRTEDGDFQMCFLSTDAMNILRQKYTDCKKKKKPPRCQVPKKKKKHTQLFQLLINNK
jgi:hypothetical protein